MSVTGVSSHYPLLPKDVLRAAGWGAFFHYTRLLGSWGSFLASGACALYLANRTWNWLNADPEATFPRGTAINNFADFERETRSLRDDCLRLRPEGEDYRIALLRFQRIHSIFKTLPHVYKVKEAYVEIPRFVREIAGLLKLQVERIKEGELQAETSAGFSTPQADLEAPLRTLPVDFSKTYPTDSFEQTLLKEITVFLRRPIMSVLYPAQSEFVKNLMDTFYRPSTLNSKRIEFTDNLRAKGFVVRHLVFQRNGVRYSAVLAGHKDTIDNKKWAIQALGNMDVYERAQDLCETYHENGYNLLIVNGPNVARSEGEADPQSMGEAQEMGICYMEEVLKAEEILLAGFSIGGAAIGEAILQHAFKPKVKYRAIRQMTFDKASSVSAATVASFLRGNCRFVVRKGARLISENAADKADAFMKRVFQKLERVGRLQFIETLIRLAGCEMDLLRSSIKLSFLGIEETIVQAGDPEGDLSIDKFEDDGVIFSEASLGYGLVREALLHKKKFILIKDATHGAPRAFSEPLRRS